MGNMCQYVAGTGKLASEQGFGKERYMNVFRVSGK